MPEPAQRDAPTALKQHDGNAQLQQKQANALQRPHRPTEARQARAAGNDAPIGGLKVATENGWFAARPSGTEDIYKIYAESFKSAVHLQQVVAEAKEIVSKALAG